MFVARVSVKKSATLSTFKHALEFLMSEIRVLVWQSMLTADMSARYWGHLAARFRKKETKIKIYLALTTSTGAVAGWSLWESFPWVWQVLSSISAVLAVSLPLLNYSGRVETMAILRGKWTSLRFAYERLWAGIDTKPYERVSDELREIEEDVEHISRIETVVQRDSTLVRQCQREVRQSRGLEGPS
jgi:hypothetical protein